MTEDFRMTVEKGLKAYSDHELGQMIRGLESEMDRLICEDEKWSKATYAANSIMRNAVGAELNSRREDFNLSPQFRTRIDF